MEAAHGCCCDLDVHAATVGACEIRKGREPDRTFGTTAEELLGLRAWLEGKGCTHAAIEATGTFWKPEFSVLEDTVEAMLVNRRHVKAVVGKKAGPVGNASVPPSEAAALPRARGPVCTRSGLTGVS